jgi:hypothetical protein
MERHSQPAQVTPLLSKGWLKSTGLIAYDMLPNVMLTSTTVEHAIDRSTIMKSSSVALLQRKEQKVAWNK